MPDATITSTASTFGTISGVFSADQSTISGTISGIVPGTLTGSVGVPGPAGPGVPAGGTSGQFLQKTSGVDYATDWVTVNLTGLATESWVTAGFYPLTGNPSSFLTASALTPYLTSATAASTYQTLAGMSSYLTTSAAAAGYYPLSGNPSGFLTAASLSGYATESWVTGQGYITSAALTPYLTSADAASTYQTLSGMSSYLTTSAAASTYQTLAGMSDYLAKAGNLAGLANTGTARSNLGLGSLAVVNDAPSDGSQYARKNAAWDVVISGDRYLTTSTTSNTISNGNKTFTIGTGLSYTPTQNITISYDASNHMHGEVLTYNSGTGVLTVDINHHTGSGTYSAWVVNVGGVTPATSVAWGAITGTLSSQTDLQNALDLKLAATTAASTYQTLSGMSSYLTSSTAASTYATILEPSVDGILTVEPSGSNSATVNVNQDANNYIHLRAGAGQIAMVYGGATKWFFNDTYLQFPGGTQQTVAYPGSSGFLLKADNLSGLANTGTARTNLGLGTMATATAADYSTTTVANGLYYPLSSNPAGYLTSAPVTSVAGRTGAITLANTDISGLGTLSTVNDAPSNGNQYARKNGAWDIVSVPSSYITSVSSPLSVTSGNLSVDLSAYLTSATAASTYQTISGMSSYLTTSTAASTYQTISGMSSYLTTSAAASTYLTQSNAASTYQTISGMSSYLTTSSAASTYQTQAGMSDYLSKAGNLAGLANTATARTNLGLGTMATATAADYSTTTAANGLYYPLSSNPAGYLTTAPVTSVAGRTGAVTLAVADVSGAAPLASPALTGTPTAPTATAGTSTTQLATTAFVTTADNLKANLASPALTGTPTAPTATAGTNTTQIATTAFVAAAIPTNNVKAWVNFNGTGTVSIRASMNVTSITDNGTADYTVNFTTAISDANYCVQTTSENKLGSNGQWLGGLLQHQTVAPTTTAVRVSQQGIADFTYCHVAILR